ncbi:A/G-specific adenine glycosylase [hydrothermal vent metagenome]|uniref:Adenine DNA glycosylase n=1 Tax=hydrothermal vent metagenome TaxID=652676 RepID=A0A1W1BVN5_9ZZZZ
MKKIHKKIHLWYSTHGRKELPWRITNDPYSIYLSEIMLQQTQVKTVLERYYFPFLKKFPTLKVLGESPLDEVLKLWEGLGYYNRAKNLHKTAQILLKEQNGVLPSELDELIKLPGIGKNTAHAIASFAFGKPVPIMEANVKRILCRIYKLKTPTDKILWQKSYSLVDKAHTFDYNQAMMDIGATICTPKNPACNLCPLQEICQGKKEPTHYPVKKKNSIPLRETYIMLYVYDNKLSLTQRNGKFLHGLWGFPSIEVPLCASEYIGEVNHTYTHFKLRCKVYLYHTFEKEEKRYFNTKDIHKLAISKVDEKILNLYLDTIHTY